MEIEISCNTGTEILFENVRENSRACSKWTKLLPAHDGHAIIVGGGPSMAENLRLIKRRHALGQHIFALNGAARFLNKNGIVPEYQVILDARVRNVALMAGAKEHLIASQCHPGILKKSKNITLWHPAVPGIDSHLPEHDSSYALVGGGTTVGLSAMCLAYTMGYRKLHLFGYDSSHRDVSAHAYEQSQNADEPICKVTVNGKVYTSTLAMAWQAKLFPECCNKLIWLGCIITVDGDGLIMEAINRGPMQEIEEKDKYIKMWKNPSYRAVSPGEDAVDEFIETAEINRRTSIIDFGCGTGRGGERIWQLTGAKIQLVDFADNCLDHGCMLPFTVADLSKPMDISADVGFCVDVMEHIPTGQIEDTIRNIMGCVRGCFFKIAMFPDNMDQLIGHPLHMSVFPVSWWEDKFSNYKVVYRNHDDDDDFPYAVFFVRNIPPQERN